MSVQFYLFLKREFECLKVMENLKPFNLLFWSGLFLHIHIQIQSSKYQCYLTADTFAGIFKLFSSSSSSIPLSRHLGLSLSQCAFGERWGLALQRSPNHYGTNTYRHTNTLTLTSMPTGNLEILSPELSLLRLREEAEEHTEHKSRLSHARTNETRCILSL